MNNASIKDSNPFALKLATEVGKRAIMRKDLHNPPKFDVVVIDEVPVRISSITTVLSSKFEDGKEICVVVARVVFNDKEHELTVRMTTSASNIPNIVESYSLYFIPFSL